MAPQPTLIDLYSPNKAKAVEDLFTNKRVSYRTKILKTKRVGVIYRIMVLSDGS
jgi:hypothetical protein